MNWDDVSKGDTVEIEYNYGGTIRGEVRSRADGIASVAGVYISESAYRVTKIRKAYKDGDIAVYASSYNGTWVGIYDAPTGRFYDSTDKDTRAPLFDTHDPKKATIIGNIKELA